MVVIKYCNIDVIKDADISHYMNYLPSFMLKEVLRYKYDNDRKSRLLARLMLQESLTETSSTQSLKDWRRNANNKPFMVNWHAFNISHSSDVVVFAYTTGEAVGIDIEQKADVSYQDILNNFHPEEKQYINSSSDPKNCFYNLWVKKEALLKAIGIGVVNGLNDFTCINNSLSHQQRTWYLKELQIHPEYSCYLCLLDLEQDIMIREFKLSNFNLNNL
ncbi:4'-phosphopantetheinyl transferase [Pedobacter psychrotolerans]|uniref:4'-phosphopantetheinyl transferase n=1 Tax=Pedobacter psychrotolerans TaxID=1843235 RepID=A0A4V2RZD0_9SPHI|nr:4'-phosphopantetheinyl transferase superfamily protein [Pedobacter psychrotolerans]TCO25215.1 4'-phosphopantetheinyl transferase [Pedobacter psychrotolerans]GGE47188.1 siderophore/surfactin biosynthesis protein [Pedobacter psychrotolerans]